MAFEFATGTINIGTGAVNTTYSVTGKTGTWKAVILWTSGRADTADAAGETDIQPSFGVAVSDTSRWAITGVSDHSPTTTATFHYHTSAACVALLDIAGAVVALADFVAFTADGFTLIVDDVFPAACEVSYVLLGGADLTNVATGNWTVPVTTGNYNAVTSLGFQPDFALFGSVGEIGAPPTAAAPNIVSIGAAVSSSEQAVLAVRSNNAVGTSVTMSYAFAGEMWTNLTSTIGTIGARDTFVSWLSNGFQLNHLEGGAAIYVHYLALKGGTYKIGDFLSATNTTAYDEAHGMSVTPKGAMFFSANRAASTQDVSTASYEWSVGASDGTTNNCQYVKDKDASNNADCFRAVSHDQCYQNADNAATMALEGEGHVNSFNATNINFQMTDADPVASFIWYIAFGDTPVPFVPMPKITTVQWAVGRVATW